MWSLIRQIVWNKLMINASSGVLSGLLQQPQGYVVKNESAWAVCRDLIPEIGSEAEKEFESHFEDALQDHMRINQGH